jgi:hypothetical protein
MDSYEEETQKATQYTNEQLDKLLEEVLPDEHNPEFVTIQTKDSFLYAKEKLGEPNPLSIIGFDIKRHDKDGGRITEIIYSTLVPNCYLIEQGYNLKGQQPWISRQLMRVDNRKEKEIRRSLSERGTWDFKQSPMRG